MKLSLRARNRIFGAFITATLGAGAGLGYSLAGYERLVPYKLLNAVGIAYGLVGVVVLSDFVTKSEPAMTQVIHWLGGALIWATSAIPLGALVGVGLGHSLPSSAITARFFASFFCYSLLILGFLDWAVVFPVIRPFKILPLTTRTHALGLVLVISGLVLQFIAAVQDLNS